ncbi:MAG: response regulator, partial [Myxococcales bacterium]|nr:response regulator [Myxococcales bacterium]
MKRILLVAADRALTRFMAEALMERTMDLPPRPDDPWDVARAHTALEAKLLVTRGGRPFDVILVEQDLQGGVLNLLGDLRAAEEAASVPVFLLTERGRDSHVRRMAVELHGVAGFLDKPVTAEGLRETFQGLERRKRVLLVESDGDRGERYQRALERVGYLVERVTSGRDALDRAARTKPDAAVAALDLPDLRGLDVCVALKRSQTGHTLPVVLYGQIAALTGQGTEENAHRADDFVQAPFDDEILVERVAQLVGLGPGQAIKKKRRRSILDRLPSGVVESEQPTLSDLQPVEDEENPTNKSRRPQVAETFEGALETDKDLGRDDTDPPT